MLEESERRVPGFRYYELRTIQRLDLVSRMFINGDMRGGTRDCVTRRKTITPYTDKKVLFGALALPDEGTMYLLAVDWAGYVLALAGFF